MRDAYFVSSLPPTIIVIILTSRGTIHGRKMFNPLSTYDKLFSTHLLQMKWNLFARLIPFMETHYLTFPFLSKSLVINYNVRGRYTVETKTTTSFLFTPRGRVQFPNSFTESYISRAAEVRYPCKNSDKKNVLLNSRRQYADFLCLYMILLYKIFQHLFCYFGVKYL